jgi:outer membrane protein TolC
VRYRKIVLLAFQEVEDALAALKSNNDRAVLARTTVAESQIAYDIAKARFDAGAIDYLNLLDAQRTLFLAQDSRSRSTRASSPPSFSCAKRWAHETEHLNDSVTGPLRI